MRKPFVPWRDRSVWPLSFRDVLALIGWHRYAEPRRSAHRHRKAGRA